MVRVRVGVWNRVSVSKTVALLRFVTLRPAKTLKVLDVIFLLQ
jgi:hypothetical protein